MTAPDGGPELVRPSLLTLVFYARSQVAAEGPARRHLTALWDGLRPLLPAAVPGLPYEPDLGTADDTDASAVLCAATVAPGSADVSAALVYGWHDVVVAAWMAAPNAPGTTWAGLADVAGRTVPSSGAGVLGRANVHLALYDAEGRPYEADPAGLGRAVAAGLPDAARPAVPPGTPTTTREGFAVWDLAEESGPRSRGERGIAVLAPVGLEDRLDEWTWSPPRAPFVRYLLHAAKLHYETRVLRADQGPLRRARRLSEDTQRALRDLVAPGSAADAGPSRAVALGALRPLRQHTDRLTDQLMEHALVIGNLRTLEQTVEAAELNMRTAVGDSFPGTAGSADPLARDLRGAELTLTQVRHELTRMSVTQEQSRALAEWAQARTLATESERQAVLTLWQTSMLGGLLMLLAAIQAFGYRVDLGSGLALPLILLLGSVAWALPVLTFHWSRSSTVPHSTWITRASCLAAGAGTGWTLYALCCRVAGTEVAPGPALLSAGAGAVALCVAGHRLVRRRVGARRGGREGGAGRPGRLGRLGRPARPSGPSGPSGPGGPGGPGGPARR